MQGGFPLTARPWEGGSPLPLLTAPGTPSPGLPAPLSLWLRVPGYLSQSGAEIMCPGSMMSPHALDQLSWAGTPWSGLIN